MRVTLGRRKTNHVGNVFQWVHVQHEGQSYQIEVKVREGRDGASISNAEAKLVAEAVATNRGIDIVCDEGRTEVLGGRLETSTVLTLDGLRRLGACKFPHHLEIRPHG